MNIRPNNDFSRALHHLRAGLTARRPVWPDNFFISHEFNHEGEEMIFLYTDRTNVRSRCQWAMTMADILAMDWELDYRPKTNQR